MKEISCKKNIAFYFHKTKWKGNSLAIFGNISSTKINNTQLLFCYCVVAYKSFSYYLANNEFFKFR